MNIIEKMYKAPLPVYEVQELTMEEALDVLEAIGEGSHLEPTVVWSGTGDFPVPPDSQSVAG
ncbi:MAG TPA: hypothetical protein ENI96_04870 [Sedimenticola thiotaurini]|uniref:Uncharacterized protein n=1 Tax=Sedimenticola thiotaurini TaxID=1543721 RepID=A0A831RKW6_9GAMM|nr:hypothetical protein [Sedimenticola thiotaurini]